MEQKSSWRVKETDVFDQVIGYLLLADGLTIDSTEEHSHVIQLSELCSTFRFHYEQAMNIQV